MATQKRYSYELKKTVVEKYFQGYSAADLVKEYDISARRVVNRWVKKVREGGYEALKDKRKLNKKVMDQRPSEDDTKNMIIEKQALQIEYLKKLLELERM